MPQLLEVSHVSRMEDSMRITIPKKAAEAMDLREGTSSGSTRTA
ncbi:MAG: hypothetical protein M0Z77_10765 [Thermoplasmatales archaeon]|nr:hypothetical protein [Thermoplasmatales archaeon]